MSEQWPEPTSAETASPGPANASGPSGMTAAESPRIAPDQEETSPKTDAPKADAPKADAPKVAAPKVEAAEPEAPPAPGKVLIMSPGDRAWDKPDARVETEQGSGKRRASAMAAVVALATVAGAIGGALATAGLGHFAGSDTAAVRNVGLEASVARLDADILALKAGVEQNARMGTSQFNKASDRLDRIEKAQAEPAAKLAKLSDAVEKLRAAQSAVAAAAPPAAAAASVTAKDVTGSVTPPATAAPSAKAEVGRLPTVEGWVLRDVGNGGALIESRRGVFEVYPGEPVPGLGRVDAIRRQDGRWVVVTSKGLIVAR